MVNVKIPNVSEKQTLIIAGGGLLLVGAITYRMGLWGDYNKGTDQNSSVSVDNTKLRSKDKALYKNIADNLYREFNKTGVTKFSNLWQMIKDLNVEELKQVAKEFGTRSNTIPFTNFSLSNEKLNLFNWFEKDIDSSDNLQKMKKFWAPTKLWL